jgi:methyltransferase
MSGPSLDSRSWYALLVVAVAAERVFELWLSRRNLVRVERRGGFVAEPRSYRGMFVFQIAFLAACPIEVLAIGRPWIPALGVPALALVLAAMALRYAAVAALGDRWSLRLVVVPGEPPVVAGPYRFVRHPNYLALAVETVALPLVHTAWVTAGALTPIIAPLLARRMRLEEAALARHSDYDRAFAGRGRLLP